MARPLRKKAKQRRARPQLAQGVWEWLQGRSYDDLPDGNRWDLLILETDQQDVESFWDAVYAAVEAGELEVSPDVEHKLGDPPLLPEEDGESRLKASQRQSGQVARGRRT